MKRETVVRCPAIKEGTLAPMKITKAQNKWITKQAKVTGESRATVVRNLINQAIEADK